MIQSAEKYPLTPSNYTDNYIPTSNYNNQAPHKSFKLLSTNFIIMSKAESFVNLIREEAPHFIAGTESWLNLLMKYFPVTSSIL